MKNKKTVTGVVLITVLTILLFDACAPLREFGKTPIYEGDNKFSYERPVHDSLKKTVVIVANHDGTELFDMIAPYYLFSATEQANVYIVAQNKLPIVVKKGLFLLPQLTFSEMDSLMIRPNVIVIPYLSVSDSSHQDPVIVKWIQKHYSDDVNILAVCDGAATAAATGIFDSKPITAHASDYAGIKTFFSKPVWVQDTSVVMEGNLFSTAGVSNATEGSLSVISRLFGTEIMKKVIGDIGYPYQSPRMQHQSHTFRFNDKVITGKKILFRKNKKIGLFLQDGINEFQLAAVMDTYNRTFPKSMESFSTGNLPIRTKYNLTLIPTGNIQTTTPDELHVIDAVSFSKPGNWNLDRTAVVRYNNVRKQYIIDECLERIRLEYGGKFENVVKLMLDYN